MAAPVAPLPWSAEATISTISSMPLAMATTAKRTWHEADESRKRSRHYHSLNKVSFQDQVSPLLFSGYGFIPTHVPNSAPAPAPTSHPRSALWDASMWPITFTEKTASGLSISSDSGLIQDDLSIITDDSTPVSSLANLSINPTLLSDSQAARLVRDHLVYKRPKTSQHERILRALLSPRSQSADFALDDAALASIFSSANELFFAGRLHGRVAWDWSHDRAPQYKQHIIGTTAIRRRPAAAGGGLETLIVLSRPILSQSGFNRRLLIFTFLHEMIHCFLFVCCGSTAKREGGHTSGFRDIAAMIDSWAGSDSLNLCDMEANLDRFRDDAATTSEEGAKRRVVSTTETSQVSGTVHHQYQSQEERSFAAMAALSMADSQSPPTGQIHQTHPTVFSPPEVRRPYSCCENIGTRHTDIAPAQPPIVPTNSPFQPTHLPSPWPPSSSSSSPSSNTTPFTAPLAPIAPPYDRSPVTNHHPRHSSHHRPHHSYDRYISGPHPPPRRPYPAFDRWDSPLLTPPSNTPSPSPSPSPGVGIGVFANRRYAGRR